MATLKEAVESGRRWRYCYDKRGDYTVWFGPGPDDQAIWTAVMALSSRFEIEPEPEKPREWTLLVDAQTGKYRDPANRTEGEWQLTDRVIRVHDADACDRLNAYSAKVTTTVAEFENMIDSYRRWQATGPGAAMRWKFYDPDGEFEVRRS